MVFHFVGHYFHYDGKFWTTLKTLFLKPGLATLEYIEGKRAKYLNPVQLYFFVTTLFFILFFALTRQSIQFGPQTVSPADSISKKIRQDMASIDPDTASTGMQDSVIGNRTEARDTTEKTSQSSWNKDVDFSFNEDDLARYDSVQNTLPLDQRDGRFKRNILKKIGRLTSMNDNDMIKDFVETFVHHFPKIFFLLLPWFAFSMWLVFYRYKRFFVDHLVFSIHYHAFLFMLGIVMISLSRFDLSYSVKGFVNNAFIVYAGVYLYVSLRRVFPGSRIRTLLKQVFLTFTYFVGFIFALIMILLFTVVSF